MDDDNYVASAGAATGRHLDDQFITPELQMQVRPVAVHVLPAYIALTGIRIGKHNAQIQALDDGLVAAAETGFVGQKLVELDPGVIKLPAERLDGRDKVGKFDSP